MVIGGGGSSAAAEFAERHPEIRHGEGAKLPRSRAGGRGGLVLPPPPTFPPPPPPPVARSGARFYAVLKTGPKIVP